MEPPSSPFSLSPFYSTPNSQYGPPSYPPTPQNDGSQYGVYSQSNADNNDEEIEHNHNGRKLMDMELNETPSFIPDLFLDKDKPNLPVSQSVTSEFKKCITQWVPLELAQKLKDETEDHVEMRIQFFFLKLCLSYSTHRVFERYRTQQQVQVKNSKAIRNFNSRQIPLCKLNAAHCATLPNLKSVSIKEQLEHFTQFETKEGKLCARVFGDSSYFHILSNTTTLLPQFVNAIDSNIDLVKHELDFLQGENFRNYCIRILNYNSTAKITPNMGLRRFLLTLDCVLKELIKTGRHENGNKYDESHKYVLTCYAGVVQSYLRLSENSKLFAMMSFKVNDTEKPTKDQYDYFRSELRIQMTHQSKIWKLFKTFEEQAPELVKLENGGREIHRKKFLSRCLLISMSSGIPSNSLHIQRFLQLNGEWYNKHTSNKKSESSPTFLNHLKICQSSTQSQALMLEFDKLQKKQRELLEKKKYLVNEENKELQEEDNKIKYKKRKIKHENVQEYITQALLINTQLFEELQKQAKTLEEFDSQPSTLIESLKRKRKEEEQKLETDLDEKNKNKNESVEQKINLKKEQIQDRYAKQQKDIDEDLKSNKKQQKKMKLKLEKCKRLNDLYRQIVKAITNLHKETDKTLKSTDDIEIEFNIQHITYKTRPTLKDNTSGLHALMGMWSNSKGYYAYLAGEKKIRQKFVEALQAELNAKPDGKVDKMHHKIINNLFYQILENDESNNTVKISEYMKRFNIDLWHGCVAMRRPLLEKLRLCEDRKLIFIELFQELKEDEKQKNILKLILQKLDIPINQADLAITIAPYLDVKELEQRYIKHQSLIDKFI